MMAETSIERELEKYFSKSSRSDWKKIAMQETNGKDPFEILAWTGKDENLFLPYYDAEAVVDLHLLNTFQSPAAGSIGSSARAWRNLPLVISTNAAISNSYALEHLSSGAEGVLFDLRASQDSDLGQLMRGIECGDCTTAFYLNDDESFAASLSDFIANKFQPTSVRGALFWESIPKKIDLDFYFNHCPNFKPLGLIIHPDTPAREITHALLRGVETFDAFARDAKALQVFRSISFSLTADASLLETVAKLKALRMLWLQVARAYGQDDYNLDDLHIHVRSVAIADADFAPHENMLKGTFAAIAAVLGGCDSLTLESEQQPPHILRWARNVSAILKEESFFNQVSDPLAGAYALDSITNETAKKAWEMFQVKWQAL